MRQWWRVAVAKKFNYQHKEIREEEGRLFGHAWLESDKDTKGKKVSGRKSLVRIRLDKWDAGKMTEWGKDPKISHPEVTNSLGGHLYLGYGALSYKKGSTFLGSKEGARKAIKAECRCTLNIAAPEKHIKDIEVAMQLFHAYGTLGGRSRNGWGSVDIEGHNTQSYAELTQIFSADKTLAWCLEREWASAIGQDEKGAFVWRTDSVKSWEGLMTQLAKLKIGVRTEFKFTTGKGAHSPELRHWLSYPVTHHSVSSWEKNGRLPNSLRFKVRRDENKKFYGVIFHMPCLPPADFKPDKDTLISLWQSVHGFLDQQDNLRRIDV
ncbi:MAG: hypothetical protein Q9O24_06160 [Gammaproteobacteria bacterium]|nr:hypothetical protein [Gammaproteobacteria bacterium]